MLENFKGMLLVHRFDRFFHFLNRFFKAFLLNWFKNLRAQFGLHRKRAGVRTPWTPLLDAHLLRHQKYKNKRLNNAQVLKVKNSTLELENDFKLINISINDMDKFEKKELTKKRTFTKALGIIDTIS